MCHTVYKLVLPAQDMEDGAWGYLKKEKALKIVLLSSSALNSALQFVSASPTAFGIWGAKE